MIEICDLVEYDAYGKVERWRVTGHFKRVEWTPPVAKPEIDFSLGAFTNKKEKDVVAEIMDRIILEQFEKERKERLERGLPANRRYRLVCCRPEEATHLSLVSVGGCCAPIGEVKKVGTVDWSKKMIDAERASGLRVVEHKVVSPIWEWE